MSHVLMRTAMAGVAAGVVVCTSVASCTINVGNHPPSPSAASTPKVSKADLEKDISGRLTTAGQTPQSVSCPEDLVGQVGQSTSCEVTMSASNSFEPRVTVTSVEGSKVNYDIAPGVSQNHLDAVVAQMVGNTSAGPPDAVSCLSGLEGKRGAVAYCDVTTHGVTTRRTVEVTDVSGLAMIYHVVPILPKAVVESSLVYQLKQLGQHPDSATCVGDLDGKPGTTVECTTLTDGQPQTYILTVTTVQGDSITYKYALKP
jgi:hypothetical protein